MFSVKLDNRELNQLQITLIKETVYNAKKITIHNKVEIVVTVSQII